MNPEIVNRRTLVRRVASSVHQHRAVLVTADPRERIRIGPARSTAAATVIPIIPVQSTGVLKGGQSGLLQEWSNPPDPPGAQRVGVTVHNALGSQLCTDSSTGASEPAQTAVQGRREGLAESLTTGIRTREANRPAPCMVEVKPFLVEQFANFVVKG
jgi:hypothetical protein